MVAYKNHSR